MFKLDTQIASTLREHYEKTTRHAHKSTPWTDRNWSNTYWAGWLNGTAAYYLFGMQDEYLNSDISVYKHKHSFLRQKIIHALGYYLENATIKDEYKQLLENTLVLVRESAENADNSADISADYRMELFDKQSLDHLNVLIKLIISEEMASRGIILSQNENCTPTGLKLHSSGLHPDQSNL